MIFIYSGQLVIYLILLINIKTKEDELYMPYSDYNSPSINSIYGTGNRTLDVIYREKCANLCGEKTYDDSHCCEGNTLEEEKCMSFKRCQEILDNFQKYVINIALISYFTLMFIVMVIVFFIYYCYTRDKLYKCRNAFSSSIIVLFASTVIPIIILQIYCWYKVITIEQFFGANFDKCFNISKSLQSVDEIENTRPDIRKNENDNETNYENENDDNDNAENVNNLDNVENRNEKKVYKLNENINSLHPSQRSENFMIEKPPN